MAAGTGPAHVSEVVSVMKEIFADIADSGITDEELQRTLGNLQGSTSLALENSDARMVRLGRSEIHIGEFVDRDEAMLRLEQVTPEAVQALAKEIAQQPVSAVAVGAVEESALASAGERVAG